MNTSIEKSGIDPVLRRHRLGGLRAVAILLPLVACGSAAAADHASGSIALKKYSIGISHVVMVRGPDEMDPNHSILRLYLSARDVSGKIKACKTLSCADQALGEGAMVDYGDSPHLGYWVGLHGELVQSSGGTDPSAFTLSVNKPDHLAGKLHFDDTQMGGPKVDADFDATLASTFKSVL